MNKLFELTDEERNIAEENYGLIYSFLHNHNLDIDSYYGIVAIGYCKGIHTYNKHENIKLSTYLNMCMNNEYLQNVRSENAQKRCHDKDCISLNAPISNDEIDGDMVRDTIADTYKFEDDVIFNMHVKSFLSKLSDTERAIMKYTYIGMTQLEIAKILGLGIGVINRSIKMIRRKYRVFGRTPLKIKPQPQFWP